MSEAVSTLASSTAENLRGNKGHLNNAIATAEVFQGIPEKATSLLNSISSMEHFESQLQAGIDESKTQFLQSFSDCKRKHFSQVSILWRAMAFTCEVPSLFFIFFVVCFFRFMKDWCVEVESCQN